MQKAIERAMQALEKLEAAIDAGDNVRIGAAMWELRRELNASERTVNDDQEAGR